MPKIKKKNPHKKAKHRICESHTSLQIQHVAEERTRRVKAHFVLRYQKTLRRLRRRRPLRRIYHKQRNDKAGKREGVLLTEDVVQHTRREAVPPRFFGHEPHRTRRQPARGERVKNAAETPYITRRARPALPALRGDVRTSAAATTSTMAAVRLLQHRQAKVRHHNWDDRTGDSDGRREGERGGRADVIRVAVTRIARLALLVAMGRGCVGRGDRRDGFGAGRPATNAARHELRRNVVEKFRQRTFDEDVFGL